MESLDKLIKLLDENIEIPKSKEEKEWLIRALMNISKSNNLSEEYFSLQDEYLQSKLKEKKIYCVDDLEEIEDGIYLWQGDITTLKVDAIVNAGNSKLLGCFIPHHRCIDNAIHSQAGLQLRKECAKIMEKQGHDEETGRAKITKAYNLPSDYIIHTVGPIISGEVTHAYEKLLASCYISSLELASKNNISTIAFCCISTGEFRFPNKRAAEIAVDTVRNYLKESNIKVIFNVFKNEDLEIYKNILGKI